MTTSLLWLTGIGWDTPVRQIGWIWVALMVLTVVFMLLVMSLIRIWKPGPP